MSESRIITEGRMRKAITDFLINFPFFASLRGDELSIVADHLQFIEVDAGHVLFSEGERGDSVYFVIDGELQVIKESVSGRKVGIDKVIIATLTRGRSIGEMSVIDNTPRSATVKAVTGSTMAVLTMEGFELILENYPRIGNKILKGIARLLSTNLRKTSSQFADHMLATS